MSQALVARVYGWLYDAIVDGFGPFEDLVAAVAALIEAEEHAGPRPRRVLDVACGTGTVVRRLAAGGHVIVGLESVPQLAAIAQQATAELSRVWIHEGDVAAAPAPGEGTFDALVSMHTLYWHPRPHQLLAGCHRALRPGGLGVFLTYARPARALAMARQVCAEAGAGEALRSLRWTLPTVAFDRARTGTRRYLDGADFGRRLAEAGFRVEGMRPAFLGGISHLAWARREPVPARGATIGRSRPPEALETPPEGAAGDRVAHALGETAIP